MTQDLLFREEAYLAMGRIQGVIKTLYWDDDDDDYEIVLHFNKGIRIQQNINTFKPKIPQYCVRFTAPI